MYNYVAVVGLSLYSISLANWFATEREATFDVEPHASNMYVIQGMFNTDQLRLISETLNAKRQQFVRTNLPVRAAHALSLRDLRNTPVVQLFRDHGTLHRIQNETGMKLQLMPRSDRNQINALSYTEIGDGIDSHTDGNVYFGNRWAGIYVVRDDGNAKLFVEGHEANLSANDFLLFKADALSHYVSRRTIRGERLVVNTLLCDVCAPRHDPLSILYQSIIDWFVFY